MSSQTAAAATSLTGHLLTIVSGASRGIGKELCSHIAKKAAPGSAYILLARNGQQLVETKAAIKAIDSAARVWIVTGDLGEWQEKDTIEFERIIGEALTNRSDPVDALLLVHNAGSVGAVEQHARDLVDPAQWHRYLDFNLVSVARVTSALLKALDSNKEHAPKLRFIVNITSLLAIKGFPSFTEYSVGKAAREAYLRVLAVEEPTLRVLSYSPGPVDTDMHVETAKRSHSDDVRRMFSSKTSVATEELHRQKLTPSETCARLVRILERNDFESGSRIDYFDEEEKKA